MPKGARWVTAKRATVTSMNEICTKQVGDDRRPCGKPATQEVLQTVMCDEHAQVHVNQGSRAIALPGCQVLKPT